MKRTQKLHLLSQALEGNLSTLRTLKESRPQKGGVMFVDRLPSPSSVEPVRVRYDFHDGIQREEQLTYAQIMERKQGTVFTLPDDGRDLPCRVSHTVVFENYSTPRPAE